MPALTWDLNLSDLLIFVLGLGGGTAVSRVAAARRMHVERREQLLDLIDVAPEELPAWYSAAVMQQRGSFYRGDRLVAVLPLIDRLAWRNLKRDLEASGGRDPEVLTAFTRWLDVRLRISAPARLVGALKGPAILFAAARRVRDRRRSPPLASRSSR